MRREPRVRVARRPVHGVLLLDKPLLLSSNQALQKAKWLLRAEKAGHTGTLDPLATGVLPLCFGAATKFSQMHLDADKTYIATLRFGQTTTTADAEGEVLQERPVTHTPEQLQAVLQRFTGPIVQIPPMHSALKKDGKALYEYARAGEVVAREGRAVTIHRIDALPVTPEDAKKAKIAIKMIAIFAVSCSKGTYIRTLAEDIGEVLGCGAHLIGLRRVQTGPFGVDACITLDALEAMGDDERLAALQPVDALLPDHRPVTLNEAEAGRFLSGLRRRGEWANAEHVVVYGEAPRTLLGTAHIAGGELIPTRLLSPVEVEQVLQQGKAV